MSVPTITNRPYHPLRWFITDALAITQRDLRHWIQQPATILLTWGFPIMLTLMFGGLFGGAMKVPTDSSYFTFLMPGIFGLTIFFGLEGTAQAITVDTTRGIIDRFRSLPINSSTVIFGRCLTDMLDSTIGLVILIGTGLVLGWRWQHGFAAALAGFGLLLFLRFALLWLGIYLGLKRKNPGLASPLQILVWPIGFLSNVFVDPATMPGWLGALATWNPLSATIAATRQLFGNPTFPATAESWAAQHAILLALLWPLLITVIFLPLSAYTFRRLDH